MCIVGFGFDLSGLDLVSLEKFMRSTRLLSQKIISTLQQLLVHRKCQCSQERSERENTSTSRFVANYLIMKSVEFFVLKYKPIYKVYCNFERVFEIKIGGKATHIYAFIKHILLIV